MATVITVHNGRDGYKQILTKVLDHGVKVTARQQVTRDLGHTTIVLQSPYDALPIGLGRNLDPRIAAVEAVQLIGGFADETMVTRVAPNLMKYANKGILHGSYGRRIGHQLQTALRKIENDYETRQAVITLWDPWLDNILAMNDYPCTVGMQLRVVNDELCMNVVMRSNDVWLGLPYDMFQFTQLQITAARVLGILPGLYHHTAFSLHLYDRDVEAAQKFLDFVPPETAHHLRPYQPEGLGRDGDPLHVIQNRARQLSAGSYPERPTIAEGWYGEHLTSAPAHVG